MILLSGGFDPLHIGHIDMLEEAAEYGTVYVALNSDDWLIRKKGFFFQNWYCRAGILESLHWVDQAVEVDDSDGTACEAIQRLKPEYFGNGGDRTEENTPELDLCKELGVTPVFDLGGNKTHSSSAIASNGTVERSWGRYVVLDEGPGYKVKRLIVDPGKATSQQKHKKRAEHWIFPENDGCQQIAKGEWHQLFNPTDKPMTVIEVQTGICEESDIERV